MTAEQETLSEGASTLVGEDSVVTIGEPPSKWDRVVKCSEGHLYTSTWVPRISLKALRLGKQRYQYCPVGHHWSRVERVDETQLSASELKKAEALHDKRIL